jgi:YD repeat-containing protein
LENPHQPTFYTYNSKGELIKITQGNPNQSGQTVQNRYFMYDSLGRIIRVRQPEQTPNPNLSTTGNPENNQWTVVYTYDVLGNVIKMTDAKGVNIINEYDEIGRPITRCYTKSEIQTTATQCNQLSGSEVSLDTPQVDYYYDGKELAQVPQFSKGALTKITNSVSETRYTSFDNHGRLLASQQITDGKTYDFSYKYNLSGGLIEETYPSLRVVKNFPDSDGDWQL